MPLSSYLATAKQTVERVVSWGRGYLSETGMDEEVIEHLGVAQADIETVNEHVPPTREVIAKIDHLLAEVDYRYTAGKAIDGAKYGTTAGPYGAAVGAGIGTAYGAFSSTRVTFDPENPADVLDGELDIEAQLDQVGYAGDGYRYGKHLGTKGRLAGAAIGAGVGVLADDSTDLGTVTELPTAVLDPDGLPVNGDLPPAHWFETGES